MANTAELDAIIIRNITEIEQGHDRIEDEIQSKLELECARIFREVANTFGWVAKAENFGDDFWITRNDWQSEGGQWDEVDHYLVIQLDWNSTGPNVSWAQTFVGGQGAQLLLGIGSDLYKPAAWFRFLKEKQVNQLVRELVSGTGSRISFDPDNKSEPLARSIKIDQEELAQAFAGEIEFETALLPLRAGLEELLEHKDFFDKLVRIIKRAHR